MIEFNNLSSAEKSAIIDRATQWLEKNKEKLNYIESRHSLDIDPINEDLYQPENWTASNWHWFFEQKKLEDKVTLSKVLSNIIPKNLFLIK